MIDLENAALQLGDKVQNFKLQTHLKCDWNISSFCVIPHKYNQSAYTWDRLFKHLRGHMHNNLSLDTSQLQATISNMQNAHLQLLPETDLFEETEESLHKLNPMMWIKTLGGLLDTIISGYKFLTLFLSRPQMHEKNHLRTDEKGTCLDGISTPAKTKSGRCSGNS